MQLVGFMTGRQLTSDFSGVGLPQLGVAIAKGRICIIGATAQLPWGGILAEWRRTPSPPAEGSGEAL